jgi:hypothetical protein
MYLKFMCAEWGERRVWRVNPRIQPKELDADADVCV